jgi:hypothetical protein
LRDRDPLLCDHGSIARMLYMRRLESDWPDPTDLQQW